MKAILQDVKDDILTKVNARMCAPALRRQEVIPEEIELKILSEAAQMARGTLYDHLKSDCTLQQLEKLAEVLVGVDRGFGTTREVGQELQQRIQSSDAHNRGSLSPETNSPSLSSSSASMQLAQEILCDDLQKECTLQQTETLAGVPVDADSGFSTAKEAGRQLQKQIQGSDAPEANLPSLSSRSASSCSPSKLLTLIITFAVPVVVIPCAAVVIKGLPICLPPWPFTNIWQHQVCWEGMPWTWGTGVEEIRLSTATPGTCICLQPVLYHGRLICMHRLYVVSWVYACIDYMWYHGYMHNVVKSMNERRITEFTSLLHQYWCHS